MGETERLEVSEHAAPAAGVSQVDITTLDARLKAVERLVRVFRVERYVYLSVSIASFLMLCVFGIVQFVTTDASARNALFTLLFLPPSGALVYASGSFLKMWNQALQVLEGRAGEL